MVKVLRPVGKFSRCVDAAIAGIALVETGADDVATHCASWDDHCTWDDHYAPPPPSPRYAHDALWLLSNHLLHRSERVKREILQHHVQLRAASSRHETMRMYDQAVADAASRRRRAPCDE